MILTKYDEKLKPLYDLIKKGNYNAVVKWVDDGNPVYNPDSKKQSALYYAAYYSMFSILEFLLSLDWSNYQKQLNIALQKSLSKSHFDNIQLLLDHKASIDSVSWSEIFDTYNKQIVLMFFNKNKPMKDIQNCLPNLNKTLAGAFKEILPKVPELEDALLVAMIDSLEEMYFAYRRIDEEPQQKSFFYKDPKEKYDYHWKQVSLIRWIGCNIRKEVDTEDGKISPLEHAIIYNDVKILKSLKLSVQDSELINRHSEDLRLNDEDRIKILIKFGLKVNNLPDDTSSFLLEHLKKLNFIMINVLEKYGAKLPVIKQDDLKSIRYNIFKKRSLPDGIFLTLANILSPDQMKYIVKTPKAKKTLKDTPTNIINNLYGLGKSDSHKTFQDRLQKITEKLITIELHPTAKRYQNYCKKSDKKYSYELASTVKYYSFKSMHASEDIRPWIIYILDCLIKKLDNHNIKFKFIEEKRKWGNIIDVSFIAKIRQYEIPIEFHERQAKPKKYLLKSDGTMACTGKLQFCHRLDGRKNILTEEKSCFQFNTEIDYLIKRLFSVADLEDKREAKRKRENEKYEQLWKEQEERERLAEEEKNRLAEQKISNKAKIEAIIKDEEDLFSSLSAKAKSFEECRLIRQYVQEVEKHWKLKNKLNEEQESWLSRVNFLIDCHDPFLQESSKSIQDIDFSESLMEKSWSKVVSYIREKIADCHHYDNFLSE